MKKKLFFTLSLAISSVLTFAQFTAGNLVVLRVGDGTTALNLGKTINVSLLEFNPSGLAGQTINLDATTSGARLTLLGNANEGIIRLSTNKQYLTFGGYDAATKVAGLTAVGNTTTKVVCRVGIDGIVDYSTKIPSTNFTGNLRTVVSNDGS